MPNRVMKAKAVKLSKQIRALPREMPVASDKAALSAIAARSNIVPLRPAEAPKPEAPKMVPYVPRRYMPAPTLAQSAWSDDTSYQLIKRRG